MGLKSGAEQRKSGQPKPEQAARRPPSPGLEARQLAVRLIDGVHAHNRPLDQVWAEAVARPEFASLLPRDRGLGRLIAATVMRRQGELEHALGAFLDKPLPADKGRLWSILLAGAAQLLCLQMPAHAVVDLSVDLTRRDRGAQRFAKLTNAVLRRVSERGAETLAGQDAVLLNIPGWLWQRWSAHYGVDAARRIAVGSLREAPLDLSVKADAEVWAERLGGQVLPTGSIRLAAHGRIEELPGYDDGGWWVQDAAAALVARAAGEVAGLTVADLCAAPGGKTASLAAAGARVTAVEASGLRLDRPRENLARLALTADVVQADVAHWSPGHTFDVVVLDAPCSATGTIRRHPDILRLKHADDIARMAAQQERLLANAARLVRPGGRLVYSTCSLEPEEGERQIEAFLAREPGYARLPIAPTEIGAEDVWMTANGDVRTLPFHLRLEPEELSGMDGFYIARLQRNS